jgi:hypothetical protein
MKFTKVAERIYIMKGSVAFRDWLGNEREVDVQFRIDGREGDYYRVDCDKGLPLWEAIDGSGTRPFPTSVRAAKDLACAWKRAANEQGTLSPEVAS